MRKFLAGLRPLSPSRRPDGGRQSDGQSTGASGSMTHLTRRSFVGAAALLAAPALIRPSFAADPVKLGCLFSSSGTMANLEGRLNHVVRMAADEINGRGGVNGRQIEVLTSDPASDWP